MREVAFDGVRALTDHDGAFDEIEDALAKLGLGQVAQEDTLDEDTGVFTEAGKLLVENEFHRVYNIKQGFEGDLNDEHKRSTLGGWRFDGLPWEQC